MTRIDVLITEVEGLHPDLERWIDNDWVKPVRQADVYFFCEIAYPIDAGRDADQRRCIACRPSAPRPSL
jgi:hypothetical protein